MKSTKRTTEAIKRPLPEELAVREFKNGRDTGLTLTSVFSADGYGTFSKSERGIAQELAQRYTQHSSLIRQRDMLLGLLSDAMPLITQIAITTPSNPAFAKSKALNHRIEQAIAECEANNG